MRKLLIISIMLIMVYILCWPGMITFLSILKPGYGDTYFVRFLTAITLKGDTVTGVRQLNDHCPQGQDQWGYCD